MEQEVEEEEEETMEEPMEEEPPNTDFTKWEAPISVHWPSTWLQTWWTIYRLSKRFPVPSSSKKTVTQWLDGGRREQIVPEQHVLLAKLVHILFTNIYTLFWMYWLCRLLHHGTYPYNPFEVISGVMSRQVWKFLNGLGVEIYALLHLISFVNRKLKLLLFEIAHKSSIATGQEVAVIMNVIIFIRAIP